MTEIVRGLAGLHAGRRARCGGRRGGRARRARRVRRVRAGVAADAAVRARRREWRRRAGARRGGRLGGRAGAWRLRRPSVRSSSRSRTCTGPSRRCATCFRRSSTAPTRRWWCCARRGPNCSTSIPRGAAVARTARRSGLAPLSDEETSALVEAVLATTIRSDTERATRAAQHRRQPAVRDRVRADAHRQAGVGRRGRHAGLGPGGDRRSAGFGRAADPRGAAGRRRCGGSLLAGRARGGGRRRRRARSARRACPSRLDRALDLLVVPRAGGVRVQPRARARGGVRAAAADDARAGSTPRWASGSRPRRATARRSSQTRWRTTSSKRCCWPTPRASGGRPTRGVRARPSWLFDRGRGRAPTRPGRRVRADTSGCWRSPTEDDPQYVQALAYTALAGTALRVA